MKPKRSLPAAFVLFELSSLVIQPAPVHADEKEEYSNILRTASALQTKPAEYYDQIVEDLEKKGALNQGEEKLENAVKDLFGEFHTEDYHRLSLALYSKGYVEESDFVYRRFAQSSKALTPEQAVSLAKGKFQKFERARDLLMGKKASVEPPHEPSQEAVEPVEKIPVTKKEDLPKPALSDSSAPRYRLLLTNGQSLTGRVVGRDAKGLWLETDPGSQVYFSKSEYKEIVPVSDQSG